MNDLLVPVPLGHPATQLLDRRNTQYGTFITHIDRSPKAAKVGAFIPAFVFNCLLAFVIIWRMRSGGAHYIPVLALFGEFIVRADDNRPWYWAIIHATFDYHLFKTGGWYVWRFAKGHLWMRIRWGFQDFEIVFRKPEGSERAALDKLPPETFQAQYIDALYRAIDPQYLKANPGFNTQIGFWKLDYGATSEANRLVSNGEVSLSEWETKVWTKNEDGIWMVWEVWKLYDATYVQEILDVVKGKLDEQGRSDIMAKWTSMAQETFSSGVGQLPANVAQNQTIMEALKEDGVDIQALWVEAQGIVEGRRKLQAP